MRNILKIAAVLLVLLTPWADVSVAAVSRIVWYTPQDAGGQSLLNLPAPTASNTSPLRRTDASLVQQTEFAYRIVESNASTTCTGWADVTAGPNVTYACSGNAPSTSAVEFPTGGFTAVTVRLQVSVTAVSQGTSTIGIAATRNGTIIAGTQCNFSSSTTPPIVCDQGSVTISSGASSDVFGVKLIGSGSSANSITANANLVVSTVGSATGTGGAGGAGGGSGGAGGSLVACGNSVVDPGESCDGSSLNNATCTLLGFSGGSLSCSPSCQFNVSSCTGGTITPTITASRTSCTAPCGINFDATSTSGLSGSNYWRANWAWDFNDPTSTHKGTIGFVVGHVFDSPGTYNVVTRVHDLAGNAGSATTTITVSAMSGTTFYVSNGGSDSNPGTQLLPWLTFSHAISAGYATNNTILLRRGDTFVSTGVDDFNYTTAGPFMIGAYTDSGHTSTSDPIITDSLGHFHGLFNFYGNDLKLQHLHLVATNSLSQWISFNSTTDDLVEYVEMEGFGSDGDIGFSIQNTATAFGVDNYLHDFHAYGIYAGGASGVSAIGNRLLNFDGGTTSLHGIRMSAQTTGTGTTNSNYYMAENTITAGPTSNSFTSFTIHGDVQHIVVVGNTVDHECGMGPTNAQSVEKPNAALVEGNSIAWTASNVNNLMFAADASNMEIRNNLILNGDAAIVVGNDYPLMPANWPDQVFVENNTGYQNTPGGVLNTYQIYFGWHQFTTGFALFENNVFWEGMTSTSSKMVAIDGAGTETIDFNNIYSPNATLTSPSVGTHGVIGDPKFASRPADSTLPFAPGNFALLTSSPAKDTGTNTHVYEDFYRVVRPQNASWDMGFLEITNP